MGSRLELWRLRWVVMRNLAARGLKSALFGTPLYLMLSGTLAAAAFVIQGDLRSVAKASVLVMRDPLLMPLFLTVSVAGIYISLSSAISVARDHEIGILETLFYAPVDSISFVTGEFIKDWALFLFVLLLSLLYLAGAAMITGFALSAGLLVLGFLSLFLGSYLAALGLFLAVVLREVKRTALVLGGALVLSLALEIAYGALGGLDPKALSEVALYAQAALTIIHQVAVWVSPFALLWRGLEAAIIRSTSECAIVCLLTGSLTVALVAGAIEMLRRRGVLG